MCHHGHTVSLRENFTPMPIRMFETYGHENIIETLPINTIENSILVIDGFWYIKKYLSISNEEQFLDVSTSLDGIMKNLSELNKKTSILWVWDGIEFRTPFTTDLSSFCRDISDKIIVSKFNKRVYDQEVYVSVMTERLRETGISVIRAPYTAAAQCTYLMKSCKTHAFSKNDALLFADCNRLIVDIDYEKSTIDVIDRDILFKTCNLTLESFRRLALLSGCEYCSTYPLFANDFDPVKVIELLKKNTLEDPSSKNYDMLPDSKYYLDYQQGFNIIENHAVMGLNGMVHIPDQKGSQEAIKDLFGQKLGARVYNEIFKCKLGAKSLSNLMFGRVRPYVLYKLTDILQQLSENPKNFYDHSKTYLFSEMLMKKCKVNIVWHPEINRAVQLLFRILLDGKLNPEYLIRFLSAGVLYSRAPLKDIPPKERLIYFSTKYSPEILEHFCIFMENHLVFNDIVALATMNGNVHNDVAFEFSLQYFTSPPEKLIVKQFLAQNITDSVKLDNFLQILEMQN